MNQGIGTVLIGLIVVLVILSLSLFTIDNARTPSCSGWENR
jgi:hypothetical protein